jgi:DNA-binding LacI/PurR family transcriptional regulator
VTGAPGLRISDERREGYFEAHTNAGLLPNPALVAEGAFTEEGGYRAARTLLESSARFTAVFAANDLSALGVVTAVVESGRRVPEDISVVGFDDIRLAEYTSPPLTTIRQPAAEIARRATELLMDLTQGKQVKVTRHLLVPELVVRKSSGAPGRWA